MITLIDYGAGNLHSLEGALKRLGLASQRAETPAAAPATGPLILPGVGHFTPARAALVERGWWAELAVQAGAGRSLLGICLGLQLLAEGSEESPGEAGLGLLPGIARRLGPGVKVPNMGWGRVTGGGNHPALPEPINDWLYFVHSFALDAGPDTVLASTHGRAFAAVQARGNVIGFQGHPEKSGTFGERLLGSVLGWMGEVPCV
jgi:imidazole glycerol phosphate synthase glutamine amidotransferase subunit